MRKLLEHCPSCGHDMIVTQQSCTHCDTAVTGSFQPNIFSRLSPESLNFVVAFVKNRGNVKEMERELGISYWAIRNRLNEVIEELGFDAQDNEATEVRWQRKEILARLEKGEIDVDEATELLAHVKK